MQNEEIDFVFFSWFGSRDFMADEPVSNRMPLLHDAGSNPGG